MKKQYPTYFDETAQLYDTIAVSAGEGGHQMILDPMALVQLVDGTLADLTV
jgi:Cys-tRNA(Pro)/Cys-tRNA(Cys) deacylase